MHPPPSLAEAPPKQEGQSPLRQSPLSQSPPLRQDTMSSIATQATAASASSAASVGSNLTVEALVSPPYSSEAAGPAGVPSPPSSVQSPPSAIHESIFSVKDGAEISTNRRANRRRTGPLSAPQKAKAALIRKMGACYDCRKRRVGCHPNHLGMTYEEAERRHNRSRSPATPDAGPIVGGRRLSPAATHLVLHPLKGGGPHDPLRILNPQPHDMMDLDSPGLAPPHHAHHHAHAHPRLSLGELRTPLPAGPGAAVRPNAPHEPRPLLPATDNKQILPGIEAIQTIQANDLQAFASRILSDPGRNKYTAVHALLLHWQDDDDLDLVRSAIEELVEVLDRQYRYSVEVDTIPSHADGGKSSQRWLSRRINDFADQQDRRDILKIVYYNGFSHLDASRDMVLASSRDRERAATIRWSGIQQILEGTCSDTLIVMDSAFFPSANMARERGVLELIAAAVCEEHFVTLERCTFTRTLAGLLRARAARASPLTAAAFHSVLLSTYPKIVRDRTPEKETISSFPSPLHMQLAGNLRLPSILLSPLHGYRDLQCSPIHSGAGHLNGAGLPYDGISGASLPYDSINGAGGSMLRLDIRLGEEPFNLDHWVEWIRLMPEGTRDVKVDGYFRCYR